MRLIRALALAAIVAAGASGVRAAEPTLGATVESHLYADEDGTLDVLNQSNVAAVFSFTPSGGWDVEPRSLTLDPEQHGAVSIVAIGEDGASVDVRAVAAASPVPGTQRGEILLTAHLFTSRPFDYVPWLVAGALALITVAVVLSAARRRTRS